MAAFGRHMREHWALDPGITYLNHGTVGAPPRRVLAAQQAIRDEVERQPSRFLLRELAEIRVGGPRAAKPRLRVAADAVAGVPGRAGGRPGLRGQRHRRGATPCCVRWRSRPATRSWSPTTATAP